MATLKVNLAALRNACEQDPTPANKFPNPGWYAFLFSCDGQLFHHAGKTYGPIPIDHGYVEVKDVPPGRYLLHAVLNPFFVGVQAEYRWFQANYTSHYAVVEVCRGCQDVCVTLANPGWHYCVRVLIDWFRLMERQARIDTDQLSVRPETLRTAIDAMEAVREEGGDPLEGDAEAIKGIMRITNQFEDTANQDR